MNEAVIQSLDAKTRSEIVEAAGRAVYDAQRFDALLMLTQDDLRMAFGVGADQLRALRESPGFPRPVMFGKQPKWRKGRILAWLDKQEGRSRG